MFARSTLWLPALLAAVAGILWIGPRPVEAQPSASDWYDSSADYVRIAVASDGVYAVNRSALEAAGLPADADPATFRLFELGREIPIDVRGDDVVFVGQRNRGTDEVWAYDGRSSFQSSDERSLFSDTTYYWMTWGDVEGLRYEPGGTSTAGSPESTVRDTLHAERDLTYYLGRPYEAEHPLYRDAEGYYWREFRHNNDRPLTLTTTLDVGRRVPSPGTSLDLQVRLNSSSASCHRVEVQAELLSGGTLTFETLEVVEWRGYAQQDVRVSISQDRIPERGLALRLRSTNDTFANANCPDPSRNPNYVLFDYARAVYTRSLDAQNQVQHIPAPSTETTTFQVSGYSGSQILAYHPAGARVLSGAISGGTATFTDAPERRGAAYWVVAPSALRRPAEVVPESTSNWADPAANGADYVILTTRALTASAQKMADFRRSHNGFDVALVNIQDVYDEFDYGRPTAIAVRRFVRATQNWSGGAPEFLVIWGDAQYPIYTGGDIDERRPEWNVSSFGYSPSDGWFAMQTEGETDWSEVLAVGRVPVRSNAQGELFVEKIRTYETAPVADWQQRMLLLAGGTSTFEQNRLQNYSNRWGEIATQRTTAMGDTLYPAGMDTLRYYKQIDDPLDTSFRDSLAVDLQRGSGWLNYFGHSAALTWEIVTDPPSEFGNAGRLPFVVSLGCRTGSFTGGRFEVKSLPSLSEQLVVGTVDETGSPRGGGLNGAIGHWGTSALSNLRPSALLNDALIDRVFRDTMRVLGPAIQSAKAEIASTNGSSATIVRHLLQYGLIGDPATRLAILDQPDFHVTPDRIRVQPSSPTPGETITVSVGLQNRGLVPQDSVDVTLTWNRGDGSSTTIERRIARFAVEEPLTYRFSVDERAIGTNTFRLDVDPANEYAESVESNNRATQTQVVFDTGLELISPVDRGTAPPNRPVLRMGIVRTTPEPIPVRVQLDTVADFSSNARQEATLTATSVKLDWTVPSSLSPGTTYYWRARAESDSSPDPWKTARFTTSSTRADWLQRDILFRENGNERLTRTDRSWAFETYPVEVFMFSERGFGSSNFGFIINDTGQYLNVKLGFGLLVLDGASGDVIAAASFPTYDLGDGIPTSTGEQQEAIDNLRQFLDTYATEGRYVFVRTRHLGRVSGPTIPEEVKTLFQQLGSDSVPQPYSAAIDTLSYSDLWLMSTRIGAPETTIERVSPASESSTVNEISYTKNLEFNYPKGTTTTPLIGPVTAWNRLSWQGSASSSTSRIRVEVQSADSTRLLGPFEGTDGSTSLASIDTDAHPYVRLHAVLVDSTTRTAPQLTEWSVDYDGVPELAVDASALQAIADTLQEGASVQVDLPVFNLGAVAARRPEVTYTWVDADNVTEVVARDTLDVLEPGSDTTSTVTLTTTGRAGANRLNGTAVATSPERITFNNTAVRNLQVRGDATPPRLRVLSEGRELPATTNPDQLNLKDPRLPFVSVQPTIEIRIEDDSEFFPIDDTSYVDVYLRDGLPLGDTGFLSTYERVGFEPGQLTFQPARLSEDGPNEAVLTYTPDFTGRDSTYTLRVEAQDGSGNELDPYEVSFRVETEQVIRDVYPYPNPMSERTTFAFRVEGGSANDLRDFRLRIYTVAGRLIRELRKHDLETGELRTDWNLLPWDGRDEDGDPVATGVYLYRVAIDTKDGTFTGDVEKVVVIR